jgi:hypothetical protein
MSSKVPQTGLISTDLKLVANDGDQLYTFLNPGGLALYSFTEGINWEGPSPTGEPTINVGQAFLYNTASPRNWTRDFNVN